MTYYRVPPNPDYSDDWAPCPRCRYPMLPLATYEVQRSSEYPSLDTDGVFGFLFMRTLWIFSIVINFIFGAIMFEARKKRVENKKMQILPQFPGSVICPHCEHIEKRYR